MSAFCPHCQKELETAQVDNFLIRLCQGCRGMLLAHLDLTQILESSWHAVSEEQADKLSFVAPRGWQQQPVLRCPDCQQAMDKYGYMGLAAILIDRCDRCMLVWLDTDELQNMVLALAKANYLSQRRMRETGQDFDIVEPAMQAAAFPVRSTAWLFDDETGEVLVLAQTLLRLFLR